MSLTPSLTATSRPERRFWLWLGLLLMVLSGAARVQADDIYGSGDFILNEGPVYSDTGNYVGYGSGTLNLAGSQTGLPALSTAISLFDILNSPNVETLPHTSHTIQVSATHGTVSRWPETDVFQYGYCLTLTATPDPGYVFAGWSHGPMDVQYQYPVAFVDGTSTSETRVGHSDGGEIISLSPMLSARAIVDYSFTAHFVPISRIISLDGSNLGWSQAAVGTNGTATFTIKNTGNSPLSVTSISYPAGFSGNWTGQIAPGSSHAVSVTFTPPGAGVFSGNIVVESDATSGLASLPITATAEDAYALSGTSSFAQAYGDFFGDEPQYTVPLLRKYWKGSVVNLQARPVEGYVFLNWTEDGNILSTAPNFDLTIQGSHEVWANYETVSPALVTSGAPTFGGRKIRTGTRRIFTLRNTGNVPVFVSGLRIANRGNARRAIYTGNWSGWLQPGATQAVPITFKPVAKTTYIATITPIADDASTAISGMQIRGSGL